MTEEEKKVIKTVKEHIKSYIYLLENGDKKEDYKNQFSNMEAMRILLNLIQKQESEINKLNNVIDRMAEILNDFDYDKQCESCGTDICSASVDGTGYTKCIKEYFMKE